MSRMKNPKRSNGPAPMAGVKGKGKSKSTSGEKMEATLASTRDSLIGGEATGRYYLLELYLQIVYLYLTILWRLT